MNDALRDQLELLPEYISSHLLLSISALAMGIGISIPLAVLVIRVRALRGPVLALAGTIQTIPSIAMLALMLLVLAMIDILPAIGFAPAVIALTLYSVLPVLRNTVTGIEEVDRSLIEAGRGMGMTPRQLLFQVQLPLAMPVIVAGIRTATVWVVGIATLATPIGATSLGNYIFGGLSTQNYVAVGVGCVAAAALALALDLLIRLMEVASLRRSRTLGITAALGVTSVIAAGIAPALLANRHDTRPGVTIGAKTFTEQYILAQVLTDQLESAGFRARTLQSLGSTIAFDALVAGEIDCYVDYTGTIWVNHMDRNDRAGTDEVLAKVTRWLDQEHGIVCLGRLGFENTYALAMPRTEAERLNIRTIDDLFAHAPAMTIGGDYEFFARPEWSQLLDEYQLEFAYTTGMDAALMYSAVAGGELDLIAAFSTDGRIAAHDLLVLEDTRAVFPPYDAVILVRRNASGEEALRSALSGLVGFVGDETMRQANMQVDVNGETVEATARWLLSEIQRQSRSK